MGTLVTFGLDISHHQDLGLDLAQARREGIEFVFIKATEGSGFTDPEFAANLTEARRAGQLVAAYHYVRGNVSAAAQVAHIQRVVPRDVPIVPDVEANSGGIALTREFIDRLRTAGYVVPLLYLPRWYWQQIGSPSLAGLPPLWSSRYPNNVVGTLQVEWAQVPDSYWNGYGGLQVAVLQFTSSARIAGHQPLDANAYRGTRNQLAILLGQARQEDPLVKNLILAKDANSSRTYVGDGMHRRWVEDPTELAGLQHWIKAKGGDPTVQGPWQDLRVLGVDIGRWSVTRADTGASFVTTPVEMISNLYQMMFFGSGSEPWKGPSLVAMIKDVVSRQLADVDEQALAAAMEAQGIGGASPAQVKAALREVFASAGTADSGGAES